jgi:hypothetical protein
MGQAPRLVLTRRGYTVAGVAFAFALVGATALVEGLGTILAS